MILQNEIQYKPNYFIMPGLINKKVIIKNTPIDIIKITVSQYYNISINEMLSESRERRFTQPRQICHWFAKQLIHKITTREIGVKVGNRNHATVLNSIKTINNLIDTDKNIKQEIKELEFLINL